MVSQYAPILFPFAVDVVEQELGELSNRNTSSNEHIVHIRVAVDRIVF